MRGCANPTRAPLPAGQADCFFQFVEKQLPEISRVSNLGVVPWNGIDAGNLMNYAHLSSCQFHFLLKFLFLLFAWTTYKLPPPRNFLSLDSYLFSHFLAKIIFKQRFSFLSGLEALLMTPWRGCCLACSFFSAVIIRWISVSILIFWAVAVLAKPTLWATRNLPLPPTYKMTFFIH